MLNSNPLKSSVKKTPADPVPTVLPEELYCLRTGRGYPVSAEEMPEITINATCSLTYKESVNAKAPPPQYQAKRSPRHRKRHSLGKQEKNILPLSR